MKLVYKLLLALALYSATTQAMQTRQTIQSPLKIALYAWLAAVGTSSIYRAYNVWQANSASTILGNSQDMLVAIEPDYERFFEAAKEGNVSAIRGFIKLGADVNKADECECTPLWWAAYFGHKEVVRLLIQANADVNKANKYIFTPLYCAAHHGRNEIVELLVARNAIIDQEVIDIARNKGHEKIADILLAYL